MTQKEAKARLKINKMLEDAGWRLFDGEAGPANVDVENKVDMHTYGDDFQNTKTGFVDYLLLNENQKPIAVLEAKRESIAPLSAKEQAREYANSLHVRYVILSNGNTHYLWDMQFGNPEPISSFPTLESLEEDKEWIPDADALANEEVESTYIAESQMPDIKMRPDYMDEDRRKEFVEKNKIKILRNYQFRAIQAVQKSAKNGNKRFLLEMATGTGKTLTCAALIKLFLKTGNAKRVLFLVDRIELENQAKKSFTQTIGRDYVVKVYKEDKDKYSRFLIELRPRIKEIGMTMCVDVTEPDGSDTWSLCYDRNTIGKTADYVVFMAFEQSSPSLKKAGTLSGADWIELNIKKFLGQEGIPKEKIILSMPFYTRLWREDGSGIVTSKVVNMKDIKIPNGVEAKWDDRLKQNYIEYSDGAQGKYKMWIEDVKSISAKLDLVNHYELAGAGFWEKDRETEDVWEVIKEKLK